MREKRISRLLTDDYSERILAACFHQARAAQEISDAYDIPIAACYRKIHELEEAGFLAKGLPLTVSADGPWGREGFVGRRPI